MIYPVLMQILQSLLVLIAAYVLVGLVARAFQLREDRMWLPPTFVVMAGNFLRWGIWIFAIMLVFEIFGLPLKVLWAGILSTALVVAVAFVASWSLLANMLSSMILIAFSRMRVGDVVELCEVKRDEVGLRGRVVDINLFFVSIEEIPSATRDDRDFPPAITQIPCHMFFFRATRWWPGHRTKPLSEAIKESHSNTHQEPPHHGGV